MSASSPRILVVDDDPDIREAARLVLESRGYEVDTAKDPAEAMNELTKRRPDVILLDVMMPEGTEGFHFLWSLRSLPDASLREIPVVILTGLHGTTDLRLYPDMADPTREAETYLPVQGFIEKPFDPPKLLGAVEQALAHQPA